MIKIFTSDDFGAPTMAGNIGGGIDVFTKCLIDGYGDQTPTSVELVGSTVTVVLPVDHGITTKRCVMEISGANDANYNGTYNVKITATNAYTYEIAGTPPSPATGTLISRKPSAGWIDSFSSGNERQFQMPNGTTKSVSIRDVQTQYMKVSGYGINSTTQIVGGEAFPTTGQLATEIKWFKSSLSSTATKEWIIIAGDNFMIYWVYSYSSIVYSNCYYFGEIVAPNGAFNNCAIVGGGTTSATSGGTLTLLSKTASVGHYLHSGPSGIAGSTQFSCVADSLMFGVKNAGLIGYQFPNPIDSGVYMAPFICVSTSNTSAGPWVRYGDLINVYCPMHDKAFSDRNIFEGSGSDAGSWFVALMAQPTGTQLIARFHEE